MIGPEPGRDLRETYRQQLLTGIGGWSGALITAIPTAVFVIVNVLASLRAAIFAAIAAALVLAGYRLARKQPVQQALSGLLGVAVAAFIAARTGQARGYFLVGIWTSFAYAVPFAVSVLVRRPLIGLLWEFLDPTPARAERGPSNPDETERNQLEPDQLEPDQIEPDQEEPPVEATTGNAQPAPETVRVPPPWYRRRPLLMAYTWATLGATVVFLARGFVQLRLYGQNATGWLAFARIAMGYPLFIAVVGLSFLLVTRARRRVTAPA